MDNMASQITDELQTIRWDGIISRRVRLPDSFFVRVRDHVLYLCYRGHGWQLYRPNETNQPFTDCAHVAACTTDDDLDVIAAFIRARAEHALNKIQQTALTRKE